MKKSVLKKLSNLALSLVVVFCAAAMLPSKASAAYGDPPSGSVDIANSTFRYQVYFSNSGKTAATATSSFGKMSGLTANCTITYEYYRNSILFPSKVTTSQTAFNSNASTSVSATAQRDSSHTQQYSAFYADGEHSVSYNGTSSHQTTRVYA